MIDDVPYLVVLKYLAMGVVTFTISCIDIRVASRLSRKTVATNGWAGYADKNWFAEVGPVEGHHRYRRIGIESDFSFRADIGRTGRRH